MGIGTYDGYFRKSGKGRAIIRIVKILLRKVFYDVFYLYLCAKIKILIILARNKKQLPLLEKVTITDVAAEGKAIARVNDMVIFVPFVAPGDVIDIQLTRKKHSYAEGKAVYFHEYSPLRAVPSANISACAVAVNGSISPMRSRFVTNINK